MKAKTKLILELISIFMIFFGIFMLCQPFSFGMYQWGFQVCGIGTGLYIVFSHLPVKERK